MLKYVPFPTDVLLPPDVLALQTSSKEPTTEKILIEHIHSPLVPTPQNPIFRTFLGHYDSSGVHLSGRYLSSHNLSFLA